MLLLRKIYSRVTTVNGFSFGSSDMPRHGQSSPGVPALLFAVIRAQWMDAKGEVVCCGGGEL